MITVSRILCPVDTSEFSARALRHAATLAAWYGAEVTVLWVRPTSHPQSLWLEYPGPLPPERPEERERAEEGVRAFVRDAVGQAAPKVLFQDGSVAPTILLAAAGLPADLLVMGTHGLSGFDRFLLGSITEKVLRKAPCAVLTVPPRAATADAGPAVTFKTIVCGVDFSRASEHALDYALSLAQEAGGRLVVVHVLEWATEEEQRSMTHFKPSAFSQTLERDAREQLASLVPSDVRTWCDPELVVAYGKPHRALLRIASERDAELIVLASQGRSAIDVMVYGSTTQQVVRQATCPVLTVPGGKPAGAAPA